MSDFMAQHKKHKGSRKKGILKREIPILYIILVAALIAVLFTAFNLAASYFLLNTAKTPTNSGTGSLNQNGIYLSTVENEVLPEQGFVLPVKWGSSVKDLINSRALNVSFLYASMQKAGQPFTPEEARILNGTSDGNITISSNDTVFILYTFWALGINNNNTIINDGPIIRYGGANASHEFASTGGYGPLGVLQLGRLNIISLNASEQAIANYTAMNSYRPCCDNPSGFPDCNHGAAALGLIELMASQGANKTAIFSALKEFNSFEFPQQYVNIAIYLNERGSDFNVVPANVIMSAGLSSASGYSNIQSYISNHSSGQQPINSGSSCGT